MAFLDYLGGAIPGVAGVGNMISSFLHPEEGYKKAGQQMQKYYVDAQGKLQPFVEQGQSQYNRLNTQANQLGDPTQLENQWVDSYSMSPYAQHLLNQAKESGLDAASSMGLMGSSAALNNIQNSAGNIMQSDRQQYMNDLMQKYMASIGIGQDIYGTGATAASGQSQNAMNQGQNMGQTAFNVQNAPGELFGKILGAAGNAAINYQTGGLGGGAAGMPAYARNAIMGA